MWTDEPLCVPVFSEEPYNDTSYNATDRHGGESLLVHLISHVAQ